MKHIFFLGISALLLCYGCEHTDLEAYEGGSSVYFSKQRFSIAGDTMIYDNWGILDSDVKEQLFRLPIYLFGTVTDYDRTIKIGTVLCNTDSLRAETNVDFRPLPTEVVLPANGNIAYVDITMLRNPDLMGHERMFTVIIEESDEFDSEYNWRKYDNGESYFLGHSMTIRIREDFPRPFWWRNRNDPNDRTYNHAFFGTYSAKKADLICRVCDISREDFLGDAIGYQEFRHRMYSKKVQRWLNEQETPYLDEDGTPMVMGKEAQG